MDSGFVGLVGALGGVVAPPRKSRVELAVGSGSVRRNISEVIAEEGTKEAIRELLSESMSATVAANAECPKCGEQMRVQIRDTKRGADTFIALLEQGEGKTSQAVPEATTVVVERPAR